MSEHDDQRPPVPPETSPSDVPETGLHILPDEVPTTLVAGAEPAELPGAGLASAALSPGGPDPTSDLSRVFDLPLRLTVEVGRARMLVREVVQLGKGSVIELDRQVGDPADLHVNGRLVGRGHLTVVDDRLAIKLSELGGAGDDADPNG